MSATHWENIYKTKDITKVSWYEEKPELSLQLILQALKGKDKNKSSVIDIGGGSSKLSHFLIEQGIRHVVVLDISSTSLEIAKKNTIYKDKIEWIADDCTIHQFKEESFDVWHDRFF